MILKKLKALPCVLSSPCQNGAACTNNNIGGYSCACVSGYMGTNCQYGKENILRRNKKLSFLTLLLFKMIKALPCNLATPCGTQGTCSNNNVGGYTCVCSSGYTGTNCNISKSHN